MRGARPPAAALCAAILALAPRAGRAQDAQASGGGESNLEIHAFYKTFGAAVRMPTGLVGGMEALQTLRDQARLAYPELTFPEDNALPQYGASWTHSVRAWGRLLLKNRVEISAGWQLDATIASDPALTGVVGLGGALPVTGSQTASRRLVDFDHQLADGGGFLLQHNLDLLAVKVALPRGEVVVGRQVLSWGTGHLWNPTDLLSPFAPTDVDREVRHGVDAVRYSLPLSRTSLLDILWLPQKQGWAQGGVVRGQANFRGFDVSLSAAKYVSDVVFGADTAGDIGPLAVHAELAYTLGLSNLGGSGRVDVAEQFLRGVTGLEWKPAGRWTVGAEYYFNGFGATNPSGYVAKLRSDRVVRGEVFGAGRHYVGLSAVWRTTELLSVQARVLGNLADPSALAVPVLEYWAKQRVLVRAGGYIPLGKGPDPGPFQSLVLSDLVEGSPAFASAASSLGLRSEYGASPWGIFAQLGVYF
jgi:hypothetical protein